MLFYPISTAQGTGQVGRTGSLVGFHFAAHKHADARHECITDGEREGEGCEGRCSSLKIHRA